MDRTRSDSPLSDRPDVSLEQRKAEFLEAVRKVDLFAPLRKHPFLTLSTALTLGLTAGAPHIGAKVKSAKSSLSGRVLKAVGLRVVQHFAAARAAKAQADAMASGQPESAQASA